MQEVREDELSTSADGVAVPAEAMPPAGVLAGMTAPAGRFRVRLSLFPAVALLIGAYTLFFAAAPAGAQTTVKLNVPTRAVSEEGPPAPVSVQLSSVLSEDVEISVKVSDASGGFTYEVDGQRIPSPSSLSLTISAGSKTSSSGSIIATADDDDDHEFIRLELDGATLPAGLALAFPSSVLIGVKDAEGSTDRTAYLSVSPNPVPEGETTYLEVHLSDELPYDVEIPVTVAQGGTAEEGDYRIFPSMSITIPLGSAQMPVGIRTVVDDDEDDETFTVELGTPLQSEVTVSTPSSVTITIKEGGGPPPPADPPAGGGGPGGGGGGAGGSGGGGGGPTQSSDASLRGLQISDGTLATNSSSIGAGRSGSLSAVGSEQRMTPAFESGRTSYTVTVAHAVESVQLTPTVNHAGATVAVNGTAVASGTASGAISLSVGENPIEVVVTAEDGTTRTYRVTATRGKKVLGPDEKAVVDKVGKALLGLPD